LDDCVAQSQANPVVLTRDGVPVAAIVSLDGLDEEQVELGFSSEFWKLIESRRRQPTITQQELERRLALPD
jgi:hypothetical protein